MRPSPAGIHALQGVSRAEPWGGWLTYGGNEAVTAVLLGIQDPVLDEDGDSPQHEGYKQVHVDEVASAMQLPAWTRIGRP